MNPASPEVLRELYVDTRQQLFTYALSITGHRDSAEDAIQAAFQKLLHLDRLPRELKPYAFRCVRNACLDGLRRERMREHSIFALPDVSGAPSATLPAGIDLEAWFAGLSPDERESIVLKIYDGFTFQEIADLRDVPLPTVASWYRRGLEKLKTFLTAEAK